MNNEPLAGSDGFYYLNELRTRLLKCLLAMVAVFFTLFPFSQSLYQLLAVPLSKQLPTGMTLIATSLTSTFAVPVKLVIILSFFGAIPVFLYQGWRFVDSALYAHEKKWFWMVFPVSALLFYSGVVFAYFAIFPLLFNFLIRAAPAGVRILPDISEYLDFSLQLFLTFGVAFEVPLIVTLLALTKILTVDTLVSKRPYIIVGAFILGMLFAPPDVISQVFLAVPLWLLFETGIVIARWTVRSQK